MRFQIGSKMLAAAVAVALPIASAHAALSYRGTLQDAGKPAEGTYDIELSLYTAKSGGAVAAGPLILYAVPVHSGRFTTEPAFGPSAETLGATWVGARVRQTGSSEFFALDGRTFANIDSAEGTCSAWSLDGNSGNPAGSFVGTADAQSLIFKTKGQQTGAILLPPSGEPDNGPNIVFGASRNTVGAAYGSTIAGGGSNSGNCGTAVIPCLNGIAGNFSAIGGGIANRVSADSAVVAGGSVNSASGPGATVSGGDGNTASGADSMVGGGGGNLAGAQDSAVLGGNSNIANGPYASVAGGASNQAGNRFSFVAGGAHNYAGGIASFAGGQHALASFDGSFVWSDYSSGFDFIQGTNSPGAKNEFLVRALGGFYFVTATDSSGGNLAGVKLSPGSGSWSSLSDRNFKTSLIGIDAHQVLDGVLALPISTWRYIAQDGVRHIGPMAQDFYAAFDVGEDDRHITEVDASGVALAAIQGLNQKLESDKAALRGELDALRARVDALLAKGK